MYLSTALACTHSLNRFSTTPLTPAFSSSPITQRITRLTPLSHGHSTHNAFHLTMPNTIQNRAHNSVRLQMRSPQYHQPISFAQTFSDPSVQHKSQCVE